jgi:hydrogenase maturation protease
VRELLDQSRTGDQPQIAVLEHEREPLGLIDQWEGAAAAVLVDAIQSGAQPGRIRRIDASAAPIPAELRSCSSTHAVGVAEAIELARALGRLPARVTVYGVEGTRFNAGGGFSREVGAVIDSLAGRVLSEAWSLVA